MVRCCSPVAVSREQQQWLRILLDHRAAACDPSIGPNKAMQRAIERNWIACSPIGDGSHKVSSLTHRPAQTLDSPASQQLHHHVSKSSQPAPVCVLRQPALRGLQFPCTCQTAAETETTCQLSARSSMMRSRYGEASDTAEDDSTTQQQPGAQPHQPQPARSSPSTNGRLNKNDFRLMCANERLYEAYSELHCLAQGEWGAAGQVNQPAQRTGSSSFLSTTIKPAAADVRLQPPPQKRGTYTCFSLNCPYGGTTIWSESAPCLLLTATAAVWWLAV